MAFNLLIIAHGCGIVAALVFFITAIVSVTQGGGLMHIVTLLVNIVLGVFIAIFEAPEILPCACLIPIKNCFSCCSSALMRAIVYTIICFSFGLSSYGYTWIASACVLICAIIYYYISFCTSSSSAPSSTEATKS